jgi:small subunit ribosomal protein S7e
MFAHKKIMKEKGADPEPFEVDVAQALCDLEANSNDLKAELGELYIVSAKEVEVTGRKGVVIFVPFKLLKVVHKIQSRLVRELEKKFSGKHVVIIGQRRIMRKPTSGQRQPKQKRPRSRTLTAVHDAILEDLVFPTEIVGKHTRYRLDGSKMTKVYLDPKEAPNVEYKVDTFATVYKKLTGKEVKFEFPAVQEAY